MFVAPLLVLLATVTAAPPHPISRLALRDDKNGGRTVFTLENKWLDTRYEFDIKIGTPPQTVSVSLDSGLARNEFYGRPGNERDPGFLSNQSSTFHNTTGNLTDTEKNALFHWAADVVSVGNSAYELSFVYHGRGFGNSGVLGFNDSTSLIYQLASNASDKRVGLFLSRHANESESLNYKDSELVIGGINEDKISGDIHYFPPADGWKVPLDEFNLNGHIVRPNSTARIRTAGSSIVVPHSVARDIYSGIRGANTQEHNGATAGVLPCNSTVSMQLTFGGKTYPMGAKDLIVAELPDGVYRGGWNAGSIPNQGMCLGSIIGGGDMEVISIGTSFLKNYYTVFRLEDKAVGFASLSDKAQPKVKGTPASGGERVRASMMVVVAAASLAVMLL